MLNLFLIPLSYNAFPLFIYEMRSSLVISYTKMVSIQYNLYPWEFFLVLGFTIRLLILQIHFLDEKASLANLFGLISIVPIT